MLDWVGAFILFCICAVAALLYIRNAIRLVNQFNNKDYGFIMIARIIGIPLPVWGIIMGFVKESKK